MPRKKGFLGKILRVLVAHKYLLSVILGLLRQLFNEMLEMLCKFPVPKVFLRGFRVFTQLYQVCSFLRKLTRKYIFSTQGIFRSFCNNKAREMFKVMKYNNLLGLAFFFLWGIFVCGILLFKHNRNILEYFLSTQQISEELEQIVEIRFQLQQTFWINSWSKQRNKCCWLTCCLVKCLLMYIMESFKGDK